MKMHEMRTDCRICGKELKADTKDDMFVSFYCMKCGMYTSKPLEDFKDEEKKSETNASDDKTEAKDC
ncbi:MAG: hypothetical protein JSV94_02810 [Methanobacteriota archaeon]|nr:MAG: hypothetical protein JSV94_02810 [Euryarchaeota archaeon]